MDSQWARRTINKLSLKYKLPVSVIEVIVRSQFETIRNQITQADPENGKMPEIHISRIGMFKIKKSKLKYLKGKGYYKEFQRKHRLDLK